MTLGSQPSTLAATPTTMRMVIGGESVDAVDGATFDIVNPADGQVIATAKAVRGSAQTPDGTDGVRS